MEQHPGHLTRLVRTINPVTMPSHWRKPNDGETCSCGRPAIIVFVTDKYGEVPSCGI